MDKKSTRSSNVEYTLNHIPNGKRIINIILSSVLLLYGTFRVINNQMYIPGRYGRVIHLHNASVWIMCGAFLCAVANMISVVIDHYDKRNNVTNY